MGFRSREGPKPNQPRPAGRAIFFYDTGNGEMLAVWDINDDMLQEYKTDISTGLGLPAVGEPHRVQLTRPATDLDMRLKALARQRPSTRCASTHDWCISIYGRTTPTGSPVEFLHDDARVHR